MCRVISCVVGRGCLLWPMRSLGKTLVSFCSASFCTPRPNLPLLLYLYFLLLHSSPLWWKAHLFLVLVLESLVVFIELFSFFSISGCGIDLDYCGIKCFALEMNRDHSIVFEIPPMYCILTLLLTMRATPFLLRDSCLYVIWINWPIPVHFSSLIPKMSMFTLAISCLTTSNLPWSMDLTFQVPMQYYSLQHWTLLPSPLTSTTEHCFCFSSTSSFFLELFLHSSPVAYWAPTYLGSSSFSVLSFCFFILFIGSQGKNTEVVCHSLLQWTTFSSPWPIYLG